MIPRNSLSVDPILFDTNTGNQTETKMASEREKEIKRRRKRRKQITHLRARAAKASAGPEKQVIADKLRNMTPGYKVLIESMGLAKK